MTDYETMGKIMAEKNIVAWVNPHQLWAMGRETDKGLEVLGMGRSIQEAFEMTMRTLEGENDGSTVSDEDKSST